jgi:hypothetical protein
MLFQGVSTLTNVSGHGGGSSGESSEIVKQSSVEHMQGLRLAVCRDTDVFLLLVIVKLLTTLCSQTHNLSTRSAPSHTRSAAPSFSDLAYNVDPTQVHSSSRLSSAAPVKPPRSPVYPSTTTANIIQCHTCFLVDLHLLMMMVDYMSCVTLFDNVRKMLHLSSDPQNPTSFTTNRPDAPLTLDVGINRLSDRSDSPTSYM